MPKDAEIKIEDLDLENIFSRKPLIERERELRKDNIEIIERKEKQKRINLYHIIVHLLAAFIILPYLALIIYGSQIPPEFSTLVSIVIGFYFARSLFELM